MFGALLLGMFLGSIFGFLAGGLFMIWHIERQIEGRRQ